MADRPPDEGRLTRRQAAAYQGAMEAVFAILIATAIGYWADEKFATSPRYLLIGVVIGFGSFVLRLVRMVRRVQQQGPDDGSEGGRTS